MKPASTPRSGEIRLHDFLYYVRVAIDHVLCKLDRISFNLLNYLFLNILLNSLLSHVSSVVVKNSVSFEIKDYFNQVLFILLSLVHLICIN